MQYIFDQTNMSALLRGQLSLRGVPDDGFLASEAHWRELKTMPDSALKRSLAPHFGYGRAGAATEGVGVETIWKQNGYELPEIVSAYRNVFSRDPSPDVEADLSIIEVALHEGATLVTDDEDLRRLIDLLDGASIASAEFLVSAA